MRLVAVLRSRRTMRVFILASVLVACLAEYTDPHCDGKQVIVELFEWKWTDVAQECERFLSKKGFYGVQVSPANEHVNGTSPPRPWWERYQPVSYKLHSRSGTEAEFADMVNRCKAVGVRVYVDVVLNHMAGLGQIGFGTDGSSFDSSNYNFPGVPFIREHFNPYCKSNNGSDPFHVRNCYLDDLTDLDQDNEYVRNMIASFLNKLIDFGVTGFRVDGAKHMWPHDITAIQQKLKDLDEGGRPMFYLDVNDQGGEPIKAVDYTSSGYVTEFRYCTKLAEGLNDFRLLNQTVDYGKGLTDSSHALVFVDNHESQRGQGGACNLLSHKIKHNYTLAVAFMLANDYGLTRVMSSYSFNDSDQGPPHYGDYTTKNVSINADGNGCGDGWICEHRWPSIANMVAFRNAVVGTSKDNYYATTDELAFSRGQIGFFAMSKSGHMNKTLQIGLPAGQYCNLITDCADQITVNGSGYADIVIDSVDESVLAFIVGGPSVSPGVSAISSGSQPTTVSTLTPKTDTTTTTTSANPCQRTVIMIEVHTHEGQDVFIRGGLDHGRHSGCVDTPTTSPCSIPIQHRPMGTGDHYAKVNAWSIGDNYLDWSEHAESGQGSYQGQLAQGTPAVWTTNNTSRDGYNVLNTYGADYWLSDLCMACNRTDNGWFEMKAVVDGKWEILQSTSACTGSGLPTTPAPTHNHWARCGMINVFHFSEPRCEYRLL